jgi:taurine dioxygenase
MGDNRLGASATSVYPSARFGNHPANYRHIEAVPLAAAMGAEIRGVDLAAIDDASFTEIADALYRHKMIFFRNQAIGHADHEAFSLRFGAFAEDAYTQGIPGHPDVHPLVKEADHKVVWVFGTGWHSDSPFLREPPAITMLRAVEVPPYGGDTIWANTALAWNMLSDTMQSVLRPLRVHFSMEPVLRSVQRLEQPGSSPMGRLAATRDQGELSAELKRKVEGQIHPLLRTHPVTGEQALYCDPSYAVGIDGMTEAESRALLAFLGEHVTQAAFTCRLRWTPGTVALWDNRLCIHQAFNDYDGFRREMYRTTVAGEVPA